MAGLTSLRCTVWTSGYDRAFTINSMV